MAIETDHHNALRQITLQCGPLALQGFSIAGLATYLLAPSLDVCFDLGECPLSSLPINHVFLTHAHGDHARCLPRHWQLRRMMGMANEAAYFLPESIRAGCEAWIRAEAQFEGVPEEDIVAPPLRGLNAGDVVQLPRRKDLSVRAFAVTHRVPSLGYTIRLNKKKLRPDYQHLEGAEIARLRREGVDVQIDTVEPLLTFIGDCVGRSLLDEEHIWDSKVVVIEATFLDPGEEPNAERKGHTHLFEIMQALETLGERVRTEHIVLKHFSMRYGRGEILAKVSASTPDAFKERVKVLL